MKIFKWIANNPNYAMIIASIINTAIFLAVAYNHLWVPFDEIHPLMIIWGVWSSLVMVGQIGLIGLLITGAIIMGLEKGWEIFTDWARNL